MRGYLGSGFEDINTARVHTAMYPDYYAHVKTLILLFCRVTEETRATQDPGAAGETVATRESQEITERQETL